MGQHVGGMVLSDRPLSGMVPIREGAIASRYIMDWNKDSVADAGFAKIDLLALPVLDQIAEALDWIEEREGVRPDLSRIDPADPQVYDLINAGRAKGVFLLQSPAQLQIARPSSSPATGTAPPGATTTRWRRAPSRAPTASSSGRNRWSS